VLCYELGNTNSGAILMTTSLKPNPFLIDNNWGINGNTYVAMFKVGLTDSFNSSNEFEQFLTRVKNELSEAKTELFNEQSTDTLGGFDIQAATAGIKDNYVIATIGGSAHNNLIENNPVNNIGSMIGQMLDIFFDKTYILSNEVRTGEFQYSILAVDVGGTIVKNDLDETLKTFEAAKTAKESVLWNYSKPKNNYMDYNYRYYTIGDEVVEMSIELAFDLLESVISNSLDVGIDSASASDCGLPDCDLPDMSIPDCDVPDCDCSGVDCGGLDCGGLDCSP
jgi:hypothetical protein